MYKNVPPRRELISLGECGSELDEGEIVAIRNFGTGRVL
jgi:hypothetical protein